MNVKIETIRIIQYGRKDYYFNNNDSDKDLRNEIFAFLATKQSVIQVRMHNTDLGQSVN